MARLQRIGPLGIAQHVIQRGNNRMLCQRYIELNPVRAAMVSDPAEYKWSSYRCHALGKPIALHTPHEEYLRLGRTPPERQHVYRALFRAHVESELLGDICAAANKGLALGGERFKNEIEQLCGRRLGTVKMGRPLGVPEFHCGASQGVEV